MRPLFRHSALTAIILLISLSFIRASVASSLTVRWVANDGHVVAERIMDLQALDALSQSSIVTSTPWTEGPQTFTGPTLETLSSLVDISVRHALLHALNDFTADVPSEDWTSLGIVLATRIDGRVPRVYEKGPYWLMYPVDSLPQPLEQKYLSRMIWQVDAITFYIK